MKIFFCYEKGPTGAWNPVIYYSEKPVDRNAGGKESQPTRYPKDFWEEKTDLDTDREGVVDFLMMALMKEHPAPPTESEK